MTLVQMQLRSANANPVHRTVDEAPVDEAMETAGPQICDDMTVEVALSVMASARAGHLLVCDERGSALGVLALAR